MTVRKEELDNRILKSKIDKIIRAKEKEEEEEITECTFTPKINPYSQQLHQQKESKYANKQSVFQRLNDDYSINEFI